MRRQTFMCWPSSLAIFVLLALATPSHAADAIYQYAVPVAGRTAYLWIPPACSVVRGTIVALANLTERQWLEDPTIRASAARECLGVIWIGPGDDKLLNANLEGNSADTLQQMFSAFAKVSGFRGIEFAPVIPMGHSAHGQFAWTFAQQFPDRTIAAIPIKTIPLSANLDLPGIPILYLVGQTTEWPQYRDGKTPGDRDFYWPIVRDSAIALRRKDRQNLVAVATDPGAGHFDWSANDASLIALFIEKACQYRLPAEAAKTGPVKLKPLRPESGWLTDTGGVLPDRQPPARYDDFQGDPADAYWFFDRDMALAASAFDGDRIQRKKQMLTYEQDGNLLPVAVQGFAALHFTPQADGITFQLAPAFLPEVPVALVGAGTPLEHANGSIHVKLTTGPAEQIGPDLFRIAMRRGESDGDIWIEEEQEGDSSFRRAVQPGKMHIPLRLKEGIPQTITFAAIPDEHGRHRPIQLHATSTSGLPVRFYVDYGPARIDGDRLILAEIPTHAIGPLEVKVVAYQWGRMAQPGTADIPSTAVQSAEPVVRSFLVK